MSSPAQDWLDAIGIEYKAHGKNVGPNDINATCPWCQHPLHMGIHKTSFQLNCWICSFDEFRMQRGRKPWLADLIVEWEGIDYGAARERAEDLKAMGGAADDFAESWVRASKTWMPRGVHLFDDEVSTANQETSIKMALGYLDSRDIPYPQVMVNSLLYTELHQAGRHDPFSGRVIFPHLEQGELMTWIGRDYTGRSNTRYRFCPVDKSVLRPKEILLGLERWQATPQTTLRVVEGFVDKLTLGDSAVAVSKGGTSKEQERLLARLPNKPPTLSVIYDAFTFKDQFSHQRAITTAQNLSPFYKEVRMVALKGGDVNELGREAVLEAERTQFILFQ